MTDDATGEVLVSTTFELPGYAVERTVGVAWGLIVRSIGVAKGLTGSFRSLRSGEVDEYTALVDNARRTALDRLIQHATALGGNAVLGVRFDSSDIGNGLSEIVAYGTAAFTEPRVNVTASGRSTG
jgi:uncharacterized protein YbjQ (UPF0145 family)